MRTVRRFAFLSFAVIVSLAHTREAATITDCTGQSDGTACDDGSTCTLSETCRSGNCLAPVSFTQAAGSPVTVGTSPRSVAVGEFSGDGTLDLAVANNNSDNITILLGTGSGGFTQAAGSPIAAGSLPRAVAVGEFSGDGILDLAVANQGAASVTVLLGTGTGGFTAGSTVPVGTTPFSIAVGDWNGDLKLDLAVANNGNANVSILLGTGAGGFTAGSAVGVGSGPNFVEAGDWDRDGRLDLAVSNNGSDTLTILRGDGSGGFTGVGSPIPVGDGPFCVKAGDWNGDGKLDLAVANSNVDTVSILVGDGAGGFSASGSPVAVGDAPFSVAIGDVNGDGDLDLAVANGNTNDVTILLGNGSAGFTSTGAPPPAGTTPRGVALGDFTADGKLDVAVANGGSSSHDVTILLNTTTFAPGGTVCDDGNPCTIGDLCGGGCVPGSGVLPSAVQFCNNAEIAIPSSGVSTPYPSTITVSGQRPYLCSTTVNLNGIDHTFPDDIDVLLARSTGSNAVIMSDVGGGTAVTGVNLTLSDAAATFVPDAGPLVSGVFKPTNIGGGDVFAAAAPAPTGGFALSAFTGTNPNGTWDLWVEDDTTPSSGKISSWCVNLVSVCVADADCNDGDVCTNDACLNGSCTHTNNTSACNDHDRCTQTDTCQSGACVGSNLVVCNDGNVCTTDTCLSGLCTYTNNTNACDDGNPCTTGDVCGPLFAEDFDSVTRPALPTGWTSTVTSGISWMTQSNGVDNAEVFGFAEYWQTLQDNVLDSPPIAIASPTSTLTFRNRWSFDHVFDLFCLDASVLEIKIGAGSFTDIVTAGGSFVSGEYTGSVFGGSNPLLGRQAWCFSSTGYPAYLTTKVNLPAAVAGQTIQLRWRIGMDSGTFSGGVGQGIDSIVLGGTCGGTVTVCNDNNPCTDDSCNPASGCVHGNNTNSCDDGNACTAGDTCRAGNCLAPVVLTQPLGSPIAVGTNPISMAVGDVSGDGKLDLAVANQSSHNVTILLGDGSGGFSPASGSPLPVGTNPVSVAAGDVNGDLKLDLVVVNASSGDATILLGNGSGGFSPAAGSPVAVGASPRAVVARDWNGDGKLDLAVANRFSDFVTILLGDGSGGFSVAAGSPVAVGTSPYSIAVGDANADGKLDLMAANNGSNNVTILLGSGSGGFSQAGGSPVAVGANPESVAAGDLNGDGKLDLATANAGSNNVTVLLGNGSGGFTAAAQSPLPVGANPEFVAVNDINGDGKPDLVVANGSANSVTILLGNGSGGFSEAGGSPVAVGTNPVPVEIGNWNADGKLDLAVANFSSSNVTILLNSTASAPNGTACNDGSACTTGDACNNGSCLGTAGSAPGEVGTVSASKSGTTATFSWVMTAGASAHDMLRGRVRDWPVGSNPATETCFDDVPGLLTASDATVPAVADGYWYLVRAENVCGNGGYGSQASHGVPTVPRSSATCP